jgi:hypothetical protein
MRGSSRYPGERERRFGGDWVRGGARFCLGRRGRGSTCLSFATGFWARAVCPERRARALGVVDDGGGGARVLVVRAFFWGVEEGAAGGFSASGLACHLCAPVAPCRRLVAFFSQPKSPAPPIIPLTHWLGLAEGRLITPVPILPRLGAPEGRSLATKRRGRVRGERGDREGERGREREKSRTRDSCGARRQRARRSRTNTNPPPSPPPHHQSQATPVCFPTSTNKQRAT